MTFKKAFLVSTVASFAFIVPCLAAAKFQRYSGAFCRFSNVSGVTNFKDPLLNDSTALSGTTSHGLQAQDATTITNLVCPVVDTDYLDHTTIKTLNLHGATGGGAANFAAKACWTTWNGNSGNCTASQNSSGTSPNNSISFTSATSVFSGAASSDFVYVFVQLLSSGSVRGYFTQDS